MEMCGSVINYLMLKRHTHIGVISIQVKQENISFPITQYSLTAVKHKPQTCYYVYFPIKGAGTNYT